MPKIARRGEANRQGGRLNLSIPARQFSAFEAALERLVMTRPKTTPSQIIIEAVLALDEREQKQLRRERKTPHAGVEA